MMDQSAADLINIRKVMVEELAAQVLMNYTEGIWVLPVFSPLGELTAILREKDKKDMLYELVKQGLLSHDVESRKPLFKRCITDNSDDSNDFLFIRENEEQEEEQEEDQLYLLQK